MTRTHSLERLFDAIDSRDTGAFATFLAQDVVFRFGNSGEVAGKTAVTEAVQGFFDSIAGLRHEIAESWEVGDALVCHGIVTCRRHDGSELTVPFANILKGDGGAIREYMIFVDTSRLFARA